MWWCLFFTHLMLNTQQQLHRRESTNLLMQQYLDAHSFLHVKALLFTNICCWDVEMLACFTQFCWTCLSPLREQSNTTSLTFVAIGRRHQTGVHEYYSLAAVETSLHWLRRLRQHTGYAHLNRSCCCANLAQSTVPEVLTVYTALLDTAAWGITSSAIAR